MGHSLGQRIPIWGWARRLDRIQVRKQPSEPGDGSIQQFQDSFRGGRKHQGQVSDRGGETDLKGHASAPEVARLANAELYQTSDPVLDLNPSPIDLGEGLRSLIAPVTLQFLGVLSDRDRACGHSRCRAI